jgi:hypothetical protein
VKFRKGWQKKGADGRTQWAFMASFDIPCNDGLYLRRLRIIETPLFSIKIHEMLEPDDQDMHDHPYSFVSLILAGGYTEIVQREPMRPMASKEVKTKTHKVGGLHLMRSYSAHRIIKLLRVPTYTLVLNGPRHREWGFYTRDGWVLWSEYKGMRGFRAV